MISYRYGDREGDITDPGALLQFYSKVWENSQKQKDEKRLEQSWEKQHQWEERLRLTDHEIRP